MAKNIETPEVEEVLNLDVQLSKAEAFIEQNLKKILIALAVVIAVGVAIWGYTQYMNNKEAKAQAAIASAQTAFAMQQYELALNGDSIQSAGFLKVINEYSGTKTANLAKLYAGLCYAQTGKTDEAIKYIEDFSQKDDQMISPASLAALGNLYVEKGDNKKGAETLVKAAEKANNDAISPVFLIQAGTIYEELGDNAKAIELYNKVKNNYKRSQLANDVDKYIERATK